MSKEYRPRAETIRKVVDYLSSIGLSVYGQNMDKSGQLYFSLMDYDADDILLLRKLIDRDQLKEPKSL